MGRKPKSRPSFFKLMPPDFTRRLRLPPLFAQKYSEILPESTKLRTSSGETWNVELEQMDEKSYCFGRGWTKFAVDVGLKIGEFMVFWFNVGKSTFDVSVYGYNGCERRISGCDFQADESDSDEDVELIESSTGINNNARTEVKKNRSRACDVGKEAGNDDTEKNDHTSEEARPQLKLRLKMHQKSRVTICKKFAVAAGLMSEQVVVLRCPPKQRCWPVLLVRYPNYSQFRLELGRGWSEFRSKNGLVFGKTYLFEYICDENVIEVKHLDRAN